MHREEPLSAGILVASTTASSGHERRLLNPLHLPSSSPPAGASYMTKDARIAGVMTRVAGAMISVVD